MDFGKGENNRADDEWREILCIFGRFMGEQALYICASNSNQKKLRYAL
jgi:hypothetical protein